MLAVPQHRTVAAAAGVNTLEAFSQPWKEDFPLEESREHSKPLQLFLRDRDTPEDAVTPVFGGQTPGKDGSRELPPQRGARSPEEHEESPA